MIIATVARVILGPVMLVPHGAGSTVPLVRVAGHAVPDAGK